MTISKSGIQPKFLKSMFLSIASLLSIYVSPSLAQESSADLAKKLSNPISSVISVPFIYNYDENIGPVDGGRRSVIKIQPVIPISLNDNWNMISRTIIPLVDQKDIFPGSGHQSGVGDILQNFFFSPKAPTEAGLIWGIGPIFLLPTASDDLLGGEKWGAGPTGVALVQRGPWTIGALANHVWSFAGDSRRSDISSSFIQPFISYNTPDAWTFSLNAESTYDWNTEDWAVPIKAEISKLVVINEQPISIGAGVRYWANSATNGPEGWDATFRLSFLIPTGG